MKNPAKGFSFREDNNEIFHSGDDSVPKFSLLHHVPRQKFNWSNPFPEKFYEGLIGKMVTRKPKNFL